jgi:hypothetical protein
MSLSPGDNRIEMRTERQIQASPANGARSRGPVTAQDKRNSSRNAVTHGLLSETIVLKSELTDRFLEIVADLEDELQPETSIEYTLIQKMAVARWRQLHLWGMEKAAMEQQTRKEVDNGARGEDIPTRASMAFRSFGDARSLDLIIRYDSLCDRQYLRAHRRYLEVGRDRRESAVPAEPKPRGVRCAEGEPGEVRQSDEQREPEHSDEKQPNEPENLLKTKQPSAPNPAILSRTRVTSGRPYAKQKPRARRYWSKRDSQRCPAVRLFNMSRPKPGPVGRN